MKAQDAVSRAFSYFFNYKLKITNSNSKQRPHWCRCYYHINPAIL